MDIEALITKARRRAVGEVLPPPDKPDLPDLLPASPRFVGFVGFVEWPEADPDTEWLTAAPAATGTRSVRCLDCKHCQPNEHTPALGWCGCAVGSKRAHGWPAAYRICPGFEDTAPGMN